MKKKTKVLIYPLVLIGVLLMFSISCKKKDNNSNPTPTGPVPVLTTDAVGNITATSATCGGNITNDGGSFVTARGICWSTGQTPSISDNKTTAGTGAGSFTSAINGLSLGTSYHVRAYATNSEGTGYGSIMSFTTLSTLAIGMSYQGGIVAYIFVPGDPGYLAGEQHGLIAAPSDQSNAAAWGCIGTSISNANGTAIGTGFQNTVYIWVSCSEAGIAATVCYDLVLGGYTDWFLPSQDELNKLYLNRASIGGFGIGLYWSSSQDGATGAWVQDFATGFQYGSSKDYTRDMRAVRTF